jgi:TonB family protein
MPSQITPGRRVVGALLGLSAVVGACAKAPPSTPSLPRAASNTRETDGPNVAGLYFDPQGADFTSWINRFKDEVYRNWIVPQAASLGGKTGHVDFELTVEKDGKMSSLRVIKSSGTASLDRAAEYALSESRYLKLPQDYGPPRVTMRVSFLYGEAPK